MAPAVAACGSLLAGAVAYQLAGQSRALAIRATLVALAGAALWLAVRVTAAARPTRRRSDARRPARRPVAPVAREIPETLRTAERDVYFGIASAAELNFRLRPRLRALAAHRLRIRAGVDLASQPEAAERLAGPDLWSLIRPPESNPERQGRGIAPEKLERAVRSLADL